MESIIRDSPESQSRAVVPGQCVRVTTEAARVGVPRVGGGADPHLEFVREGDVIQAIDITCICGHRIRIRCLYQ
jgi:hypothetical protein